VETVKFAKEDRELEMRTVYDSMVKKLESQLKNKLNTLKGQKNSICNETEFLEKILGTVEREVRTLVLVKKVRGKFQACHHCPHATYCYFYSLKTARDFRFLAFFVILIYVAFMWIVDLKIFSVKAEVQIGADKQCRPPHGHVLQSTRDPDDELRERTRPRRLRIGDSPTVPVRYLRS
jgi:hypothetical protein